MSSFIRTTTRASRQLSSRLNTSASRPAYNFHTTSKTMAQSGNPVSETISQTARQEGGTTKGSMSAQMQSQVGKERNYEQAAQEVGGKMQSNPAAVTPEDANYLKFREARAEGVAQPGSDSLAAEAQRVAAANEKGEISSNAGGRPLDPTEQSAMDRARNFQKDAENVTNKMANNPEKVTKEEGDLLHSREQRAFGETSKGGIASQAQSLATENERKGTVNK